MYETTTTKKGTIKIDLGLGTVEAISDIHDGRTDLRATIQLPSGFMVEIAIEDVEGVPDVALYAGTPMPLEDCPPDLVARYDLARLIAEGE
jgi:hypothetical protein